MTKKILLFLIVIVTSLAVGFFGADAFQNWLNKDNESDISLKLISGSISEINEYATLEYYYTDIGKSKIPAGKQLSSFLGTKSFAVAYDGVIKMGIAEKIDVEKKGNQIIVKMPPAEILSHEIDTSKAEVFDQKNNVFNPIKIEDANAFYAENKKKMEDKVINSGFLKKAEENAKYQTTLFIKSVMGNDDDYEIIFE